MASNRLQFDTGEIFLRQKLLLSLLSGKSIVLRHIRSNDDNPGIREFEEILVRLLDKLTNGTKIDINVTGTQLKFFPGMLLGGKFDFDCSTQRCLTYFLEVVICLAPFCKEALDITLRGITNDVNDISVDHFKQCSIPLLKRFLGSDEGLSFEITKRGCMPDGGGEIHFKCPTKSKLRPLQYIHSGKIRRIRGIAWATKTNPSIANRMVDSARSVLNQLLTDIYIHTDHRKGKLGGSSPGFGITLIAETLEGTFIGAEQCSNPRNSLSPPSVPEDLGVQAAHLLLEEIYHGGTVGRCEQRALVLMALGQKDVSKMSTTCQLTPYTISLMQGMRDFFHLIYKIDDLRGACEADEMLRLGGDKVVLTCVGVGFSNLSKGSV